MAHFCRKEHGKVHSHCEFVGTTVMMSGQQYENCSFINCELVVDGRPVHLVGCSFDGCHWSFVGPAGTTLELLGLLCRGDPELAKVIGRLLGFIHEEPN